MIKKCITLNGHIINIGTWDFQVDPDGNATNPLPDGAIEEELDIIFTGEKYIRSDSPVAYQDLRRPEYPPLEDQLDAIWKGGNFAEEMRLNIMAIKAKYPNNSI